jgi:hypothetical protein
MRTSLKAHLIRIITLAMLAIAALVGQPAAAGAASSTFVFSTYNVLKSSPDSGTRTDLRTLLSRSDALVLQEVGTAPKKQDIDAVRTSTTVCPTTSSVIYSPGSGGEAIVWHPDRLTLQTRGSALLNDPTAVGNPNQTIPKKWLTWGKFHFAKDSEIGTVHLVSRPHVDNARGELLQREVEKMAAAIQDGDFKRPLVGGDFNVDFNDPWLNPLRGVLACSTCGGVGGMLNDHEALGPQTTFFNASDGAPRTFDQVWFRPAAASGMTPTRHEAYKGSSDHYADIVTFTVQ